MVETLIVMTVTGVLVAALAAAFMVIVEVAPDTEVRIDDARSTRGLATWLAHDTTSTPRFEPEQAEGGIDTAARNDCNALGTNIVHLRWVEDGFVSTTFVANYRFVVDGGQGRVVRYTCSRSGAAPFGVPTARNLTSGLSTTASPTVTLNRVDALDPTSEVESIDFNLTALSGEQVSVQTGSRNPTDGF